MRISFHTVEVEHHPLCMRKLSNHPHKLRLRNLQYIFILRFRYLLLRLIQLDGLEAFLLPESIDHQIDRHPGAPGLQSSRRTVLPYRVKDLYDAVMHQVARLISVPYISDTERIEGCRIPCIQLFSGLFVSTGAQFRQSNVLYVYYLCQLVFCLYNGRRMKILPQMYINILKK